MILKLQKYLLITIILIAIIFLVFITSVQFNSVQYIRFENDKMIINNLPPLYIITPTYRRPEQLAELTRLGYTLKHVKNLFWLVVEDSLAPSKVVTELLEHIGVRYEHLIGPKPIEFQNRTKGIPRGVSNRNRGLLWIRENYHKHITNAGEKGVLYFADDDNTYDITIFEEMRYIKKVAMWPVGLVTHYGISTPVILNGKRISYYDGWIGHRKYPIDMAGFAVSVDLLLKKPNASMPFKAGYEEDGFLKNLSFADNDIEYLAKNCTKILTWHTQTKRNGNSYKLEDKYRNTNLMKLREMMIDKNF